MASNRKYSNGTWKDESKKQESVSSNMFLRFQELFGKDFTGMSMSFDQSTGQCGYTYSFTNKEYFMLLSRDGSIIQENLK